MWNNRDNSSFLILNFVTVSLQKNGFFVEIGASDGESGSVSLYFERTREWEGLLIEPHPGRYRQLRHKHRKATTLKACVRVSINWCHVALSTDEADCYFFLGGGRVDYCPVREFSIILSRHYYLGVYGHSTVRVLFKKRAIPTMTHNRVLMYSSDGPIHTCC